MSALDKQEGGDHYKDMPIQPVEFIYKNGIGYLEGNAIKYLVRWRSKGGVEDLKKARHYIDLLIEMEDPDEKIQMNDYAEDLIELNALLHKKYEEVPTIVKCNENVRLGNVDGWIEAAATKVSE